MDSTTVKALRIMEALSVSDDERGVSELSRQVGLTKSNTFRILSTLVDQGYVQSNPETSRYFLTLKIWEQGARVIDRNPIRRVARPHLQALFGKINETILVSVIDLPDVLYIEKIESDNPVRASARVGQRAPALRAASGKSILAFYPDETIKRYAKQGISNKSDLASFQNELSQVRQQGFAISISGSRPGVNSIAVPIWDGQMVPGGALSVSGPSERCTLKYLESIASDVINTSTLISGSLGVSSPTIGNFAFVS